MNIGASYNLEINKIILEVNKNNFKKVVLQFPDGLKYYSNKVVDILEEKTDCFFCIYFGSCFGACDVPLHLKELDFDLCVQFGHNVYLKKKGSW